MGTTSAKSSAAAHDRAYQRGLAARGTPASNPYTPGSYCWIEWRRGFFAPTAPVVREK